MGSVDWQIKKTPLECTKYLLENEINCDVNFKIGEDSKNIKAHKLILSMRSPVFDRMFNGGFKEIEKGPVIPDVTAGVFQTLLRYCYYECIDIEDGMALPVLYASTKYMLPLLEEAARKKLKQILGAPNVWDIYGYAISVGDAELHDACKDFFEGDITPVKEALQTEGFLNISHEVLLDLMHINDKASLESSMDAHPSNRNSAINSSEIDQGNKTSCLTEIPRNDDSKTKEKREYKNNFGISISEIGLFKACNAWAEAECLRQEIEPTGANKRTVLGEVLFLLRLPTMLPKDLMTVVYASGILTMTEIVNLGQFVHRDSGSECQVDFPSNERLFVVTAPEIGKEGHKRSTMFIESGERVMLSRVWTEGSGSFQVTLKNEMSEVSLMKCDTQDQGHKTNQYNLNFFDITPQLLVPNIKYSVSIEYIKASPAKPEKPIERWITMGKLSPFKEVKISKDPDVENAFIYALTLCLV